MSSYPFNNNFAKQFRQEPIVYSCGEETTFQNVLFRTFGINKEEVFTFGKPLVQQLNDNALIHRMLVTLINTNAPHLERVAGYVQEVKNELAAQANAEPYAARYYNMLTEVFTAFGELVDGFQRNGHQMLCDKLTEFLTGGQSADDNQALYSEAVKDMYGITEDYLHQMGYYYEYFHVLLQQEAENNSGNSRVIVMTHVEYYLDTLITCTEKLIRNTESTLNMASAWLTAIETRDAQELYN